MTPFETALTDSRTRIQSLEERIAGLTVELTTERVVLDRLQALNGVFGNTASNGNGHVDAPSVEPGRRTGPPRLLTARTGSQYGGVFATIRPVVHSMPRGRVFGVTDVNKALTAQRNLVAESWSIGFVLKQMLDSGQLRREKRGEYFFA